MQRVILHFHLRTSYCRLQIPHRSDTQDNQPSTVKSSTPSNNQSGVDNADSTAEEGEDEEASSHNSEKELRLFEKASSSMPWHKTCASQRLERVAAILLSFVFPMQAKQLYLKGVLAERSGRMYDG